MINKIKLLEQLYGVKLMSEDGELKERTSAIDSIVKEIESNIKIYKDTIARYTKTLSLDIANCENPEMFNFDTVNATILSYYEAKVEYSVKIIEMLNSIRELEEMPF